MKELFKIMKELFKMALEVFSKLLGIAAAVLFCCGLVLVAVSGSAEDFAAICGILRYSAGALSLGLGLGACGVVVRLIGGIGNE